MKPVIRREQQSEEQRTILSTVRVQHFPRSEDDITAGITDEATRYLNRDIIAPADWWFTWCYPNEKRQDSYYYDVPDFKHMNPCVVRLVDDQKRKEFVKQSMKVFEERLLSSVTRVTASEIHSNRTQKYPESHLRYSEYYSRYLYDISLTIFRHHNSSLPAGSPQSESQTEISPPNSSIRS